VEADPGLPGGDPIVVGAGVGETCDLRGAALILDVNDGIVPAVLVRGEGPCIALVGVSVGSLPVGAARGASRPAHGGWYITNTVD
jgi:hypothetical protein